MDRQTDGLTDRLVQQTYMLVGAIFSGQGNSSDLNAAPAAVMTAADVDVADDKDADFRSANYTSTL